MRRARRAPRQAGGSVLLGAALGVPAPGLDPVPPEAPVEVELVWEAPEGCPAADELRQRVARLTTGSATATVEGLAHVAETPEGFTARLELRTAWATSTRTLEAERCSSLADAVALLVAIAIDPIAVDRTLDEAPAPAPTPAGAPVEPPPPSRPASPPAAEPPSPPPPVASDPPPRPSSPSRRPEPADERALQLLLRPTVGVSAGLLPRVGPSLHAAAGLRWRWLRAGVQASHWLPRLAELDARPEPVAELRLWGVGVHGCAGPRWGRVELTGCVALHGGRMRGEGRGTLDRVRVEHRPWVAASIGPALVVSLAAPIGLWVAVDGTASLYRPRFHVQGLGSVHEVGPLAFTAQIGLEVRLGLLRARRRAEARPRAGSSTDRGPKREG